LISVTGTVEEFRPKQEPLSLPLTELSMFKDRDVIKVVSKANPLPKPITLTAAETSKTVIDALEKYEGMRVSVSEMTVVAPTNGRVEEKTGASESDGVFYAVVKGMARPFREIGLDVYDYVLLPEKEKRN
jgi:hypothetical protein